MGPEVELVDSAEALAEAAEALLADGSLRRRDSADRAVSDRRGELGFLLSDIPWKFAEIGARFLGRDIGDVRVVDLDELEAAGRALDRGARTRPPQTKGPT
jgi:glutamate racemase